MSAQKRARACCTCHSLKIRCELGSTGGSPPCERCVRLGKDCVLSVPKRQKDRVADLEAQVDALTRLLQAQGLGQFRPRDDEREVYGELPTDKLPSVPGNIGDLVASGPRGVKKRRLDVLDNDDPLFNSFDGRAAATPHSERRVSLPTARLTLDQIVPIELQARILAKYREETLPIMPLVPIPEDWDLETLRAKKPTVLQAIIYAASPGILSLEGQEDIAKLLMSDTASCAIVAGERSLELIQAIQIASSWYRSPKHHKSVAAYQLIELAHGMAIDLGLGGSQSSPSLGFSFENVELENTEAWRAWLVCHMLSTVMAIHLRRPFPHLWTQHHANSLLLLGFKSSPPSGDLLLCQYIRGEHLCEQIASELSFADLSLALGVADPTTKLAMQRLRDRVLDWKAQIPTSLRQPSVLFWEHVATLYVNEPVLHTPTNGQSFAAPFVAGRLSVTDFPTTSPLTLDHATSIHALCHASHALMDLFATFSSAEIVALPGMVYAARTTYALYVLVKLYIATTAEGNTFGSIINGGDLRIEEYLQKLVAVYMRIQDVGQNGGQYRILSSVLTMEEWFSNYKASLIDGPALLRDQHGVPDGADSSGQDRPVASESVVDVWDEFMLMPDGAAVDFDLGDLFADPGVTSWSLDA